MVVTAWAKALPLWTTVGQRAGPSTACSGVAAASCAPDL